MQTKDEQQRPVRDEGATQESPKHARAQRATFAALVLVSALGFALPAPGREDGQSGAGRGKSGAWSLSAAGSCKAARAGAPGEDAAGFPFETAVATSPPDALEAVASLATLERGL